MRGHFGRHGNRGDASLFNKAGQITAETRTRPADTTSMTLTTRSNSTGSEKLKVIVKDFPDNHLSGWLSHSKIYVVLEISTSAGRDADFRLIADNGTPGYFDVRLSNVTSQTLSQDWGVKLLGNSLTVAPTPFLREGFWVEYFDGVPAAEAEYDKVVADLTEHSPHEDRD